MISDKRLIDKIYDRFYVETIFDRDSYKRNAENEVDFISLLLSLTVQSKVLDIGCGIGFHANRFAQRGCQTVGVDLSSACIEGAQERFKLPNLEFCESDAKEYAQINSDKFDLVVNLGMSFGYSLRREQSDEDLKCLAKPLKKGGHLVIQNLNKKYCIEKFRSSTSYWRETDEYFVLDKREIINPDSILKSTKIFINNSPSFLHRYEDSVTLYEVDTLTKIFEEAGLEYVCGYHSFEGGQIDEMKSFLPIFLYRKKY